jgi:hypothetical protein
MNTTLKSTLQQETKQILGEKDTEIIDIAGQDVADHLKRIENVIPGSKEFLLGLAYKTGSRVANPLTYEVYQQITELLKTGKSINSTAKQLKIPYSTCHYYSKLTPEVVAKLKKKSDEKTKSADKVKSDDKTKSADKVKSDEKTKSAEKVKSGKKA